MGMVGVLFGVGPVGIKCSRTGVKKLGETVRHARYAWTASHRLKGLAQNHPVLEQPGGKRLSFQVVSTFSLSSFDFRREPIRLSKGDDSTFEGNRIDFRREPDRLSKGTRFDFRRELVQLSEGAGSTFGGSRFNFRREPVQLSEGACSTVRGSRFNFLREPGTGSTFKGKWEVGTAGAVDGNGYIEASKGVKTAENCCPALRRLEISFPNVMYILGHEYPSMNVWTR
ncbi:hypothetical protein H6P81_004251 [Aristolochia fimbriata]|uniref:Uncharacterized protein n=1 Tax=Aristolochia fimbriata TaxID=158543 RepID=A0AAV7FF16_ARIFI|nr:hypothetical protein H6P81_004251 [Aristolochia fimbriata]